MEKEVSTKNTKAEILKAYDELLQKLEQSKQEKAWADQHQGNHLKSHPELRPDQVHRKRRDEEEIRRIIEVF